METMHARTCCNSSPEFAAGPRVEREGPVNPPSQRIRGTVGVIVPFLRMTPYNFSFLSARATAAVIVHPGLNVIRYNTARLIVRIHEIDMMAGQALSISAYGTNPSQRDPREFALPSSSLSVSITSSNGPGSLAMSSDSDLLPYLKMVVTGQQDALTGSLPLYAVLSADLVVYE